MDFATQPEPTREGRNILGYRQIIYLMALRFHWMELNDDTLANLYDVRGARGWLVNVYFRGTCYGSFGTYLGNKRWLMRPIWVDKWERFREVSFMATSKCIEFWRLWEFVRRYGEDRLIYVNLTSYVDSGVFIGFYMWICKRLMSEFLDIFFIDIGIIAYFVSLN